MKKIFALIFLFLIQSLSAQTIRVGAKHFNEGYILSEILSRLLESEGYIVERKFNLGGTLVCYEALVNHEIDVYPEYTGTISEAILKEKEKISFDELQSKLNRSGLEISREYGFNNSYALAVRKKLSDSLDLKSISDLSKYPELKFGLSYEFLNREDGWKNLAKFYGLSQNPVGLEHGLAYKALEEENITFCTISYPNLPEDTIINSDTAYVRYHGRPKLYVSDYSEKEIKDLYDSINKKRKIKDAYIYFDNTGSNAGYENAFELLKLFR